MKRYFIKPGKTAIVIITNYIKETRYIAKELGLIEVNFNVWRSFSLNHENKVLVL